MSRWILLAALLALLSSGTACRHRQRCCNDGVSFAPPPPPVCDTCR